MKASSLNPLRIIRSQPTLALIALVLSCAILVMGHSTRPTLHLCGDSTMADKPLDDNPERGWGQLLPLFFSREIRIINYARNGRSTKSFIREGLWERVLTNLKPGDYVLIQFGHNDAKISDTSRYAEAHTDYRWNLIRFVTDTRSRGGIPVLITPVNRRKFSPEGRFIDQHGAYPEVVREVAREYSVPLIDLHARSRELLEELGPEKSESLFLRAAPGIYKAYPEGKADNTHFTRNGACAVARLVVQELQRIDSPLCQYLIHPPSFSQSAAGKVVGLDYYFYAPPARMNEDGRQLPAGYTWEERGDSGFYELGNLFENTGAFIAEVKEKPTAEVLERLSIYLIVAKQHPIHQPLEMQTKSAILQWVQAGGVLVLMQAALREASTLNELTAPWGITFHEVQSAKDPEPIILRRLPSHPIFEGLKVLSWQGNGYLQLGPAAQPLLLVKQRVVMASTVVGRGLIVALTAPWLRNSYFYSDNTSIESESWQSGENFCAWLLSRARRVR